MAESDATGGVVPREGEAAVWFPARGLVPWEANPKRHSPEQLAALRQSIEANGWGRPVVAHWPSCRLVAGHGATSAVVQLLEANEGLTLPDAPGPGLIPVRFRFDPWGPKLEALALADNRTAELSDWIPGAVESILRNLEAARQVDEALLAYPGWSSSEIQGILAQFDRRSPGDVPDPDPESVPATPDSVLGLVYELGPHRLACGDSTDPGHVGALLDGLTLDVVHADPPYGMGKERDGVLNDNLYGLDLDRFQGAWWRAWRPRLSDRGSAFVWGAAEDLWRWWFGPVGPGASERVTLKNEIVWTKGHGQGMSSSDLRSFAVVTERCLFFMLGQQSPSANLDDYFEGWEPVRAWLEAERNRAGWTNGDVNRITGTNMAGHWFGRSQWYLPTREHYLTLRAAAGGRYFSRPYDAEDAAPAAEFTSLRAEFTSLRAEFMESRAEFMESRAWFDNAHEPMTDVWAFPRVASEDRLGHATPKPVALVERAVRSACPEGGWVGEPFGGTGTTLIAAARSGRRCATMELSPGYCDVIRRRWTTWARAAGVDPGPGGLD